MVAARRNPGLEEHWVVVSAHSCSSGGWWFGQRLLSVLHHHLGALEADEDTGGGLWHLLAWRHLLCSHQ